VKNVNVTPPGGDGNPGAGKKRGLPPERRSRHVATHPKKRRRQERAWARGAERPKVREEKKAA
jgi:hypothetical protein